MAQNIITRKELIEHFEDVQFYLNNIISSYFIFYGEDTSGTFAALYVPLGAAKFNNFSSGIFLRDFDSIESQKIKFFVMSNDLKILFEE